MERDNDAGMTFRRGACGSRYEEDLDVDEYRDEPEDIEEDGEQ